MPSQPRSIDPPPHDQNYTNTNNIISIPTHSSQVYRNNSNIPIYGDNMMNDNEMIQL